MKNFKSENKTIKNIQDEQDMVVAVEVRMYVLLRTLTHMHTSVDLCGHRMQPKRPF